MSTPWGDKKSNMVEEPDAWVAMQKKTFTVRQNKDSQSWGLRFRDENAQDKIIIITPQRQSNPTSPPPTALVQ